MNSKVSSAKSAKTTLQKVVFPTDKIIANDAVCLYFSITGTGHAEYIKNIQSRESFLVKKGKKVSFASYFNAFPASYYAFHTSLKSVYFEGEFAGRGKVRIYESFIDGSFSCVAEYKVNSRVNKVSHKLSLTPHKDGGWFYFEVEAEEDLLIKGARWVAAKKFAKKTASIAICTMNKPDYVIKQLKNLIDHKDETELLKKIVIVDQGTDLVKNHPEFKKVSAKLDNKVVVIEQGNYGGSGGFSRGMYEGAYTYGADFVLLLDDDTYLETASLDRIITFGSLCKVPSIVGGHMFWLDNLSVLNAFSETVNVQKGSWGTTKGTTAPYRFTDANILELTWIHKRWDSNYTGWWMCLIPSEVIKNIGLSLPMFIKWDDVEYSLRAEKHGYPTISFPTTFVWHESWLKKDDAIDWTAFYHARNRLITGLLYNKDKLPVKFFMQTGLSIIKDLFYMRYSLVELKLEAMKSVMKGPKAFLDELPVRIGEIRKVREQYTDSTVKPLDELPKPSEHKEEVVGGLLDNIGLIFKGILHQFKPVRKDAKKVPETYMGVHAARILRFLDIDSAVYTYADGKKGALYVRDREKAFSQIGGIFKTFSKFFFMWPVLKGRYKATEEKLSSPETWKRYFDAEN